jgi:hypothetical protein
MERNQDALESVKPLVDRALRRAMFLFCGYAAIL